jgi:hypothetical protein
MRCLRTHPITDQEIIDCLMRLSSEIRGEGRRGDIRPMLLSEAATIVEAARQQRDASKAE